ncbi:NAD(P)/FAD-dependent oxidoreductase [Salinibacter altiplanensis]|uniref:NAD(P)/FAD-dependent oxidoreductase n=1 Tax=Salinibacter altiplanensis TaxID=1803181 RepID=UPI000C9F1D24|nr:FAD-binding oxidoreductase [Salinibacter altiplanensis]
MTVSIWQQAHQEQETAYDVVVVGGGIVGCSTAYWLGQRAPSLDVALLEARTLGAEASGRNAGFVLQGTHADYRTDMEQYGEQTARRLWQFTRKNRDLLAAELHRTAFSWRADGSLVAAGTETEDKRLRASLPPLRTAGAPAVHLDAEETNARIGAAGFHGGLFVTTGAAVNPLHLVQHVAAESGADVHTQHPVDHVRWRGTGAVLETPDRHFRAPRVVFALGPALPALVPEASPYVRSVRAQMLATTPANSVRIPVPVYSHRGGFYVRQRDDRRLLVGGGRHSHREAEETSTDATTPAVQATIERYLHTHFPWSQSLAVEHRWSGTMGFSPDGRPVVGRVPGHPDGVFATGFTGHGMGYGFRMGRLLADMTCGDDAPEALDLFAAARFNDSVDKRSGTASN